MTRRIARVAAVAALAAAPLAVASPASASAECFQFSQPPRASGIVCVGYDPNLDWYCVIGVDRLVFVCPT